MHSKTHLLSFSLEYRKIIFLGKSRKMKHLLQIACMSVTVLKKPNICDDTSLSEIFCDKRIGQEKKDAVVVFFRKNVELRVSQYIRDKTKQNIYIRTRMRKQVHRLHVKTFLFHIFLYTTTIWKILVLLWRRRH